MSRVLTITISIVLVLVQFLITSPELQAVELTLENCIEEALRSNPRIARVESEWAAAREKSEYAQLQRFPEVTTQFSYFRLSDVPAFSVTTPMGTMILSEPVLDAYNAQVNVLQPLFTGFRISGQIRANRLNSEAVLQSVFGERSSLIMDITEAYYTIILVTQRQEVINERIGSLRLHLDNVRHFYEAGLVTKNDVLQTEVALSNGLIQLNQADSAIIKARVNLANLLGRDRCDDVIISPILPDNDSVVPDINDVIALAIRQRYEIEMINRRIQATDEMGRVTRSAIFPSLYATGTYNVASPNSRYQPIDDSIEDDWSLGIVLRFIPFDWGRTHRQLGEIEAGKRQLIAQLEQVRQAIIAQVITIHESLREISQRSLLIARKVLQAEESLRVTRELYAAGVTTNSEVLDAETNLLLVHLERTQVRIEHIITTALLEFATADNIINYSQGN